MTQAVPHPETRTLNRSLTVQNLIQRVFSVTFINLSELNGKTIEEYCNSNKNIPRYLKNFFSPEDHTFIRTNSPENYNVKLLYKLLKTVCGLENPRCEKWNSHRAEDTFEYLITFCWTEYQNLLEASAVRDDNLHNNMDKILEALELLIVKVENVKNVDESSLKIEVKEHIGEKVDSYNNTSSLQYMYMILNEHSVHQMLVMVYRHLNRLNGMSLSNFLNYRKINLVPRTCLSSERKFLNQNPPPEKIPTRILFQVVKRVCFNFELRRSSPPIGLEALLSDLKREYYILVSSDEKYTSKCYKIYELLANVFRSLSIKTGKESKFLIGNLARETFVTEPIQKSLELPVLSKESVSSSKEVKPTGELLFPSTPEASASSLAESSTFTIEEINVCVLFRVICPGGLACQTLALVFIALKGNLAATTKNNKVFKDSFLSVDRKYIKSNIDNTVGKEELMKKDITFLCEIIKSGCPSMSTRIEDWQANSGLIEGHITIIRKERNKLAHEVSKMETKELKARLELIENSLDIILEKTESMLTDDEHDMKKELQKQRNEVRDVMQKNMQISSNLDVKSIWKEMNDSRKKVKIDIQDELKQTYLHKGNFHSLSPISGSSDPRHDALTVTEVFVERELEDKDDIEAESSYTLEDVLFCQKSALASSKVFIIHSGPGGGRTSLCKYATHLWSKNVRESSEKGVEVLFYIPCRYITTKSLATYLKEKLPYALGEVNRDDIIPIFQEPEVTFVIDGYDEAVMEGKCLFNEILTTLPRSKVIITTKTQWLSNVVKAVKSETSHYKTLSIAQMTEEKTQEYVKKFFLAMKRRTQDCDSFLRYLDGMKEKLNQLIHVPLTLSLLALLWMEEPGKAETITTLSQLYNKLMDLILVRVAKQLGLMDTFLCHEWMIALGELAWENLKQNKHYFSEKDLALLKRRAQNSEIGIDGFNHIISSFMHCEIHDSLIGSKMNWTFAYPSQQEYFVAEFMVDKLSSNKETFISTILELPSEIDENYKKQLQKLILVVEFICGLLIIRDRMPKARIRELTEIMLVKEPWCFGALENMFGYRIQKNLEIKDALEEMFIGDTMRVLDNYDLNSVLWVLKNTSLKVQEEVSVINTVSDVPKIIPLLDFLLLGAHRIKVTLDVDKVTNISCLVKISEKKEYKDIKIFFASWKPLLIQEIIMNWPFTSPLCLSLCPTLFPLVWWEVFMCLLSIDRPVTRLVCSPIDQKWCTLIKEAAASLKAEVVVEPSLTSQEIVIHANT